METLTFDEAWLAQTRLPRADPEFAQSGSVKVPIFRSEITEPKRIDAVFRLSQLPDGDYSWQLENEVECNGLAENW